MQQHIEKIFTAIFENLKMNGSLDHYLKQIENTEVFEFLIFKSGLQLVDEQEDYVIQPTTYEVWLDMKENAIIYIIGNLEVYREQYRSFELLNIFQNEAIIAITEPDEGDIKKYLTAVRLLNPQISIGKQAKLDQIISKIRDGELPTGRYFEKKEDGYYFLEITEENNEAIIKKMFCSSSNQIIYALNAGGDLNAEGKNINEKVYEIVSHKIQRLSTDFNKEVLMSLISLEHGISDYNELLNRVKRV